MISAELAEDAQFRVRFQREAAIAAQIEHPNVIPVYAVGDADGTLFIAMRFVDGLDLRALLAREPKLEPARAASIVDQVAQALDAAHAHGLVHRDVKPANILIATDRRTGARLPDRLRRLAPDRRDQRADGNRGVHRHDRLRRSRAGPRGARGRALRRLLAGLRPVPGASPGTVPFQVDNDLAKLYAHGSQPAPSVLEREPSLPPAFEAVLSRAMAKDPRSATNPPATSGAPP